MLEVADFSVWRHREAVCQGIDLTVPAGEVIGVVGPNGAGKSTLLAGLRGLLPTEGTHRIDGRDARNLSRREIARAIAVVPQRTEFAFPYRVEEMVLFGRAPHRKPWESYRSEDREAVRQALESLNLTGLRDVPVDAISGGERRKVFLARALVQECEVLILDEPFVGLDPAATEELRVALRSLATVDNKCMVVVLHDVSLAARLADRVLGLDGGRPAFLGSPADVLTPEALRSLFGVGWERAPGGETAPWLRPRIDDSSVEASSADASSTDGAGEQ